MLPAEHADIAAALNDLAQVLELLGDYPTARALKTIMSYVVAKTPTTLEGAPSPYDYIERVEVTEIDAYRQELAGAEGMVEFFQQWSAHIGESIAVFGDEIE